MMKLVVAYLEHRRISIVKQHVVGRLLDVGCGPNKLVRAYGNGVGVDIHDWGDVDYVIQDASQLPFEDSTFDTVSFVACLNHIPNREAALREAWRVLRPDGLLLVTMIGPKISRFWHKLVGANDPDQHERGAFDEGEVWGLTVSEVHQLVFNAGFALLQRKQFVGRLNSLYVAKKRLPEIHQQSKVP